MKEVYSSFVMLWYLNTSLHFTGNGKPCPYGQSGNSLKTCSGKLKFIISSFKFLAFVWKHGWNKSPCISYMYANFWIFGIHDK